MQAELLLLVACVGAIMGAPGPNGTKFNSNKVGEPLSKGQKSIFGRISYLGEFNNKEFYIVRKLADQATARTNCRVVGLKLAEPDQSELDFLYKKTYSFDNFAWTDGVVGFQYADGSHINSDIDVNGYLRVESGLVIDRYNLGTFLRVTPATYLRYYLCYA